MVLLTQGAVMSEWIDFITAIAALLTAVQWPLLALTIGVLFRDDIKQLMRRSRSWKVLGVEGEFADLVEDLADSTSMPGESGPALNAFERGLETGADQGGDIDSWSEIFRLAAVSPRAALMQLWAEIEATLIDKAQRCLAGDDQFDDLDASRINMKDATNVLVTLGLMPQSLAENLADFREIRNRVVHGGEGSDTEILSAIDSGLTILRQLETIDAPDEPSDEAGSEHVAADTPAPESEPPPVLRAAYDSRRGRVDSPTLPAPGRRPRPRRRTPS
jgi:hypothetical protein